MPENGSTVHIPTVLWAQRDDLLYLTVAVEDIEKPEIKVEANNLSFKLVNSRNARFPEIKLNCILFAEEHRARTAMN